MALEEKIKSLSYNELDIGNQDFRKMNIHSHAGTWER